MHSAWCIFLCVSVCVCLSVFVCEYGCVCVCIWCACVVCMYLCEVHSVWCVFCKGGFECLCVCVCECVCVCVDLFAGTAGCIFEKCTVKNYFVANNTLCQSSDLFIHFVGLQNKTDSKDPRIGIRCYLPQNAFFQCIFQKYT